MKETKKGLPYWQQVIVMLCMGWIVIWIYRSSLTPVYPEIQETIGKQTDAQMGLIASFYFFGYTGMQILAGILVDKFGKKQTLIPDFILFALAPVLIASANSIMMIYMGSLLAGIGCGSYYGAAYSLSAESISKERRGFSTAIINSGSAVGMGIGLIGSSFLVKNLNLPWQMLMFICSALIVMMIIIFATIIRSSRQTKLDTNIEPNIGKEKSKQKESIFNLFKRKMIASYILYFATCYGYYMVVTWLPSFLQHERGFEGVAIGFSSSLVAFSSIPGALFFSRLSDKFREKKVIFIILLEIAATSMLLLTVLAPNATFLLVSLILYGLLGKLAVEPILISYVADSAAQEGYGTTFGVFNFFGMSSSVLAPAVTGFISDTTGTRVMGFYLSALILLVGTLFFLFENSRKKVVV